MSRRPKITEPRYRYWLAGAKGSSHWFIVRDPIPDIDRAEWISEIRGPFASLEYAKLVRNELNQIDAAAER
jgi:hypothetical protein